MNIKVTWDVMEEPSVEALPEATRDRMDAIHHALFKSPKKILGELRELSASHPDVLCLKNWLIAALRGIGGPAEEAEAADLAERLFRERPDYFFARTGLADIWLDQGKFDQAAGLMFGPGKVLTLLYPGRKEFHISEIRHWAYVCCRILISQGNVDGARTYRDLLNQMEPGSRAVESLDQLLDGNAGYFATLLARFRNGKEAKLLQSTVRKPKTPSQEPPSDPAQPELF
jgi:hypothetical protein